MQANKSLLRPSPALWVPAALVIVLLPGCQRASGPQRVEELRARYDVRLNGFIVREAPLPPAAAAPTPGMDATPAPQELPAATAPVSPQQGPEASAVPGAPDVEVEDLPPPRRDVVLDLLVHHDAPESLPGITVDVSQAGVDEVEKRHFRVWIDTSRIARGQNAQVSHILEDVDFAPGDRFAVELVSPVPAEQRGEYREFQAQ